MRLAFAVAMLTAALFSFAGSAARVAQPELASGQIAATDWAYVPGSTLPVRVDGFPAPYRAALVGPGSLLAGGLYAVPANAAPGIVTLIAGNARGLAVRNVRIGPPPPADQPLLAIASYDDGIVFHDARDFSVLGILATGGTPSDVAIDATGRIAATDTQGSALTLATLAPWSVGRVEGVPLGDEIAVDETTHAVFVSNRDIEGAGALTRVSSNGHVDRIVTGRTAEGLAIDERRQIVYVANVNDDSVAAVDARTLRILRRIPTIPRVFSLALSPDATRLYGISNQSAGSPFAAPGAAIAISLTGRVPRVVARSANLTFPLGTVLDAATNTLFVTDEALDTVDVLDARTLRPRHTPLPTCRTPWKPALDPIDRRLYIPCARANEVDVFDTRTLRRVARAPFATGSYPLAVTVWHGARTAK